MSVIVLIACIKNTLFQSIKTFLVSGSEFALRHLQLYPHHEVAIVYLACWKGPIQDFVKNVFVELLCNLIMKLFAQHLLNISVQK